MSASMPDVDEGGRERIEAERDAAWWRRETRRFHLERAATRDPGSAPPSPAAAGAPILGDGEGPLDWPVLLANGAGPAIAVTPFGHAVRSALDELRHAGEPAAVLEPHVGLVVRSVERRLDGAARGLAAAEAIDAACRELGDAFDASEAGRRELGAEIERLRARLPRAGRLVGFGEPALYLLYHAAVSASRRTRRAAFAAELRRLVARLDELLRVDDALAPERRSAASLGAELGAAGLGIDPAALAASLPAPRGSRRMPDSRRARVEAVRERLARAADAGLGPDAIVFATRCPAGFEPEPGFELTEHPDGLRAATAAFDRTAVAWTETLRAARIARLEIDGAYVPDVHDEALEAFGWESFEVDELLLMPAIAAIEPSRRLVGPSLAAFSELLRSGRPVHVIAAEPVPGDDVAVSATTPGTLAVAHREAFVLQSTLARPAHVADGLVRIASAVVPAVALVAVPATPAAEAAARTALAAALAARATPCFRHDPQAGTSWADRFDLDGNPQVERPWPIVEIRGPGGPTIEEAFTFAHAAALDPALAGQFRVVPAAGWDDDQVPIAAWLELDDETRRRRVPYLWVVGEDGEPVRAVPTRTIAFACRDRARAWRVLQELAGTDNEHARRAAAAARREAEAEAAAAAERLRAEHAAEVERVRREAAGEAMERLTAVLLDLDSVASSAPPRRSAPVPAGPEPQAEPAAPAAAPAAAGREDEDEAVVGSEPWVDSILCTTCNECTNLNGRLFRYNANRQAEIADPAAGTFEQLVRAAEKCPARCIHVGPPRPGDPTATPEILARAAAFR